MVARADILAGRAVIVVDIQDQTEKGLRSIRSTLRTTSNAFKEIGGDLFRGGLVGSLASLFPVKEFISFQDQILFLQTKLRATDKEILPLEAHIRDLGRSTSFSSQEVAKAAVDFAQAGFSIKETIDSLQAALDLARGGQIDLTTSTTILSNALRTFGKDATFATDFASKFIAASRLGTLDLVDLGESLKYASGTFATLGVEIEDVLGLITTLSLSGLKASLAGTSLNTAFLNLAGSADKLQSSLGIAFSDEDFKDPILVLGKLRKALDGMSKTKQLSVVQDLVNIRGGRAIFGVLLQGLGRLDDVTKQITQSTGESRTAAEKLDSRLGGVLRRSISAFQELSISIGATSEGPLTKFGTNLTKVMNDLSRLATLNQEITQTLLVMGPAALVAGVGILSLSMIMGRLTLLIAPLLSLNSIVFKLAANLAGLGVKNLSGLKTSLIAPIIAYNQAVAKARKTGSTLPLLSRPMELGTIFTRFVTGFTSAMNRLGGFIAALAAFERSPKFRNADPTARIDSLFPGKSAATASGAFSGSGQFGLVPQKPNFAAPPKPPAPRPFTTGKQLALPLQFDLDLKAVETVAKTAAPTFTQSIFNFEGGSAAAAKRTAAKLAKVQAKATLQAQIAETVKATTKFRSLGVITQEAINAGIALVSDRGAIKANPALGLRISQAIADITSNMPKSLAPEIARGIRASFAEALKMPILNGPFIAKLPVLTGSFNPVFKQLELGLVTAADTFTQSLFAFEDVKLPPLELPVASPIVKQSSFGGKGGFAARQALIEEAQAASVVKKGKTLPFLKNTASTLSDIFKEMGRNSLPVLRGIATGFRVIAVGWFEIGKAITSVNWLAKFVSTAQTALNLVKGIASVSLKLTRLAFSFNGLMLLLLFRDKIPIIKQAVEGLGRAFSAMFSGMGATLGALKGPLQGIVDGIRSMFSGNIENGVETIKTAFSNIGSVISTGLTVAWKSFLGEIETGVKLVKEVWAGIEGIGSALAVAIGTNLGLVFKSGKILIGMEGEASTFLQDLSSGEFLKGMFAVIIAIIGSIGQGITVVIRGIFEVLGVIKVAMLSLIAWFGSSEDATKADADLKALNNSPGTFAAEAEGAITVIQNGINAATSAMQEAIDSAATSVSGPTPEDQAAFAEAERRANPKTLADFVANLPVAGPSAANDAAKEFGKAVSQIDSFSPFMKSQSELDDELSTFLGGKTNEEARTSRLLTDLNGNFLSRQPGPETIPEVAIAKQSLPFISEALVGDFQSTRNNTLQAVNKDRDIAKETAEATKRTADNTDPKNRMEAEFG